MASGTVKEKEIKKKKEEEGYAKPNGRKVNFEIISKVLALKHVYNRPYLILNLSMLNQKHFEIRTDYINNVRYI